MIKDLYKKTKNLFDRYERYLSPIAMAIGFVVDNLTLRRIDLLFENMVIIGYLSIAVFCILYLNAYRKGLFKNKIMVWPTLFLPFVLQFAFGGLFSAFMVFYSRSSSFFVSWPFLLILMALIFGNEIFRKRYERLNFHIGVLYLAIFSYSVFALPVLIGRIGADVFLASGGASLLVILLVIMALYRIDEALIRKDGFRLSLVIASIFTVFNFLYFMNIIPPIPLAMKAGGVYHDVRRIGSGYRLLFEKPERSEFWRETSSVYHYRKGDKVFIFSSIFAPTRFNEQIFHRWFLYDKEQLKWIEKDKLGFSIAGGRDGGYRGYSVKTVVSPGKWRVDVSTERGQVLGRINFEIREGGENIKLAEEWNR